MSNYTIQWGDTLSGIAKRNNTDVNTLMNLNPYITNANKIYAGKNLVLPDAQPTQSYESVQQSQPTKTTQQLAEDYARNATANVGSDTQALLSQYEKIAEQQKQALQQQKELAQNQINSQKDEVMQTYNDNARQAYINSMLGKKSVAQQLSQAKLNTSGLVGSAYANVENAYGNNLATLQGNRDNSINNINKQLNESNLQYAIQESKLLSDIEDAKLELQKYGNELAYKKYQDALSNYLNFANYDRQKYTDDRDFNYQKERDAISDSQWQQEFELAKKKASSSGSSRRSSSKSNNSYGFSNTEDTYSRVLSEARNVFSSADSESRVSNLENYLAQRVAEGTINEQETQQILNAIGIRDVSKGGGSGSRGYGSGGGFR